LGSAPLILVVRHWENTMIDHQNNPKKQYFGLLLVDDEGLKALRSAVNSLSDNEVSIADPDSIFPRIRIMSKLEIIAMRPKPMPPKLKDAMGLLSCAGMIVTGIAVGVAAGTVIIDLIHTLFRH
jgi:hypothetical protein